MYIDFIAVYFFKLFQLGLFESERNVKYICFIIILICFSFFAYEHKNLT